MGNQDADERNQDDWYNKDSAQWRKGGKGKGGKGGKQGKDKQLDCDDRPELKGRSSYVVCKGCHAWFWAYGVTGVDCSCCGRRHSKLTLQACADVGAVIDDFVGRQSGAGAQQASSGKAKSKDKGAKRSDAAAGVDAASSGGLLADDAAGSSPADAGGAGAKARGDEASQQHEGFGDKRLSALELERCIAEAQARGLPSHGGTISIQPLPAAEQQPKVKEEVEPSPDDQEQAANKALRNAEFRRGKARDKWKKTLAEHQAAAEAVEEERERAKERLAKLQEEQRHLHELANEQAEQFQAVEAEYTRLLEQYDQVRRIAIKENDIKSEQSKPSRPMSKKKEDKLWSKLEHELVSSLRKQVGPDPEASAAEQQAIQGCVAQALLEAKCAIHSLRLPESASTEDYEPSDLEMPDRAGEEVAREADQARQSCLSEEPEQAEANSEELLPETALPVAASQEHEAEPPAKKARTCSAARAAPY